MKKKNKNKINKKEREIYIITSEPSREIHVDELPLSKATIEDVYAEFKKREIVFHFTLSSK